MCILCSLDKKNFVLETNNIAGVVISDGISLGQVKIFPKEHFKSLNEIPDEILKEFGLSIVAVTNAMVQKLNIEGYNVIIDFPNNLEHFSFDIVPRRSNDNISFDLPVNESEKALLEQTQQAIKQFFFKPEQTKTIEIKTPEQETVENVDQVNEFSQRIP